MTRSLLVALALVAIPAAASAQVASRDIARGTVLSRDDIAETDSTVSDVEPGWVARRKINAGELLREPAVAPPELVQAGKPVRFRVSRNDVSLLLKATAISSGRLGDTVLVRLDTHMRFRGIVTGAGTVIATDSTGA